MLWSAPQGCDDLYHNRQPPPFFIPSPTCLEVTLYSTTNSDNTTRLLPRSSRHGRPQPSLDATVATRAIRPDADSFSAPAHHGEVTEVKAEIAQPLREIRVLSPGGPASDLRLWRLHRRQAWQLSCTDPARPTQTLDCSLEGFHRRDCAIGSSTNRGFWSQR